MRIRKFSKEEALRFGWDKMKANFWPLVAIFFVAGLIYYVPGFIAEGLEDMPILYSITNIIAAFINIIIQMGIIRVALKYCDNQRADIPDLFRCLPLFVKFFFGSILYSLIVLGGLILLIIPGIIWSVRFGLYSYFIVDKGLGPIEALKMSSKVTQGAKLDLFIFWILLTLVNLLGFLALIVGLFATMPTTMIASAFVYRKLAGLAEAAQPQTT